MTQHDYNIANQSFPSSRTDINNVLASILSINSGLTAPSTTVAGMLWYDTTNALIKQRDATNTSWITRWDMTDTQLADIANDVQAFGIGAGSITLLTDLNSPLGNKGGASRVNSSTTNLPSAWGSDDGTALTFFTADSNNATQLLISKVDARTFVRSKTAGSWTTWQLLSVLPSQTGNANKVLTTNGTNASWTNVPFATVNFDGTTPVWASTTTITMGTLNCLDSLRTSLITCSSVTLNFGTTGLNGLDTGAIASNTWYYIYAILNPTTLATGYLASTSASSPTLPSGFTKFRLLPFVVKTNSGSATLQSFTMYHSDGLLRCEWLASRADQTIFTQTGMGSATPYVVDASSSVPPICNGLNAKLFAVLTHDTGNASTWSRLSIDPSTAGNWQTFSTSPWVHERLADIPLYPTTRQFRIRNDAGGGGAAVCTGIVTSQGYVFNYKGTI